MQQGEGDAGTAPPGKLLARIAANAERLRALGILPENDPPPFDIIGDVHGCAAELLTLLSRLGYARRPGTAAFAHPDGRRAVFVGDLVDRGPNVVDVLRIVHDMREAGDALLVIGNHDHKFLRWLRGRPVRIAHGLATTIAQLSALLEPERSALMREADALFASASGYLLLDGARLVVTADGRPDRRDWGALRDLRAAGGEAAPRIVYGHQVVPEPVWVNRTLNLDTGCVYGGRLSALRYPELELVQVPAERAYAVRGGRGDND